MRLIILVTYVAAIVVGCAESRAAVRTDDSPRVAQAVADAQAGLDAFKQAPGVTFDANAGQILAGVAEYNQAAAGKSPLPAPVMSPAEILASPGSYSSAAVSTRQHADGTWLKVLAAAGASLALGVLAKAGSFIPGVGPFVEPVASLLGSFHWFATGSKQQHEADAKAAELAGHAKTLADSVAFLAPDYRSKLPPAVVAAIDSITAPKA